MSATPGPQRQYFEALAEGRLLIQRCSACGRHQFPSRALCVNCGGPQPEWVEPQGLGVVYSASLIPRKEADGGDYNVVLVDLEEGVRMMSTVLGIAAGTSPPIGLRVRAQIEQAADARRLVFVPFEVAA